MGMVMMVLLLLKTRREGETRLVIGRHALRGESIVDAVHIEMRDVMGGYALYT